jgi:putative tryptophan/tyrosine transport system substrate-binding protein
MRRREFIGVIGGAVAAWPLLVRAQQPDRMRHIGVLMSVSGDDPEGAPRIAAFSETLHALGWADGHNIQTEIRWTKGPEDIGKYVLELVRLAPDLILTAGSATLAPLLQATRTIPIVFVHVPDPVGAGFVQSLARPGANATGFINFEYGISGKWLALLKEIAPSVKRVAVLRDPAISAGIGQFAAIQSVAPSFSVDLSTVNVRDPNEIETTIRMFANSANGGLIVTASALAAFHRNLIIKLANEHKLPAVYSERYSVVDGGLISYGPDLVDQYRRAAGYVDRILKGEKPSELPVQTPVKYELLINLRTAKALGLSVPPTLLAQADDVIE